MNFKHILSQTGVMKTLSIAQRVSDEDIKRFTEKYYKLRKKPCTLADYLRNEVGKKIQNAFENHKVPGLIFDDFEFTHQEHQKLMELTQVSSLIAKKLVDRNLDKFYYCFVIHSLVNMLGLSDDDFSEFHRKFSKMNDDDEDGEEEI